ncbi:MAG: hypothetical protein FWD57_11220 [Polyangiaceae bacterium]|nr:hypothetical protein [Polyangiaceae bacterium]
MSIRHWVALGSFVGLITVFGPIGCGDSSGGDGSGEGGGGGEAGGGGAGNTGGEGDDGGPEDETGDGGSGAGAVFDPDAPGIRVEIFVNQMIMMGMQEICMVAGDVMPAGREDFEPDDTPQVPLETCVLNFDTGGGGPSCQFDDECAPEQKCLPSTKDGQPIENTEHCQTPRGPINVGPISVSGFKNGTIALMYDSANGAYKPAGSDGQVDCSLLNYNTTYTLAGDGSAEYGLGPFTGQVRLGGQLSLTKPAVVAGDMGGAISIKTSEDLVLEWAGSDPNAIMKIDLMGAKLAGDSGTITCRTKDTGRFTIPGSMISKIPFGMQFLNHIMMERRTPGTGSGDGLTRPEFSTIQMMDYMVSPNP